MSGRSARRKYGGGIGCFVANRVTTIVRAHDLPDAALSCIQGDGRGDSRAESA